MEMYFPPDEIRRETGRNAERRRGYPIHNKRGQEKFPDVKGEF